MEKSKGVKLRYSAAWVNEFALDLGREAGPVLKALQAKGILGGIALSRYYPERKNEILVAVTEVKKKGQLDKYVAAMKEVLA